MSYLSGVFLSLIPENGVVMLISRKIASAVADRARKMPVIALLGPRQSGKTTLARELFKSHAYISLENFDYRELARIDPRNFLQTRINEHGIILDEVQHVPQLLSYIQTYVDEQHRPGHIILTGSQNILVNQAISQSLAGRVSIFTLLPLSISELRNASLVPSTIEEQVYKGGYPRIYAHDLEPNSWYLDYIETYVERDVRQIAAITDLMAFRRFMRLCAGRVGQLLNIASLATDCGIDQRTVKAWLSVLEASYIIFRLEPHYKNFSKRLVKTPKLFFYDTGLACALLEIKSVSMVHDHYLRGGLVESLIVSELFKQYYNHGDRPHNVFFWRNQSGNEIDCVITKNNRLVPIEIKASTTLVSDFFKGLAYWHELTGEGEPGYIIYGGLENQRRLSDYVISWQEVDSIFD